MERQPNEFNLTIGGQIDQIDVQSLATTLLSLNEVLKEINTELKTDRQIELTVKTYRPGSFDIYLQLFADATALAAAAGGDLFNPAHIETAKAIIGTLTTLFKLKKHLRGEKASEVKVVEGNNYEISNNTGSVMVIDHLTLNLSSSEPVDLNISKMFQTLNNIPYVDKLSIRSNDEKPLFEANKKENDFNNMIYPTPLKQSKEEILKDDILTDQVLSIFGLVFTTTRKWEFYYHGNKINAKVKDPDFLEDVLSRKQRFANGDRLLCDMIIHKKYNESASVFENTSYTITKVKDRLPPEQQQKIKQK